MGSLIVLSRPNRDSNHKFYTPLTVWNAEYYPNYISGYKLIIVLIHIYIRMLKNNYLN